MAPADPGIAAGPTQVVETTNSTIYVFSRTGGYEFSFDFNTMLNGTSAFYQVTDPRVVYDKGSGRFFISELDIYTPANVCGGYPDFDVVLVSPSSTLASTDKWYGFYWSPFANNADGLFADQPGLGISSNLVAATQTAYDNCTNTFVESELLVVQKSDLLNRTFVGASSAVNYPGLPFALQPVQEIGSNPYQYVVFNNSDSQEGGCSPSCSIGVLAVTGTPRTGNVAMTRTYEPMTPTSVGPCPPCSTPPADQPSTSYQLQTDDDRFLNAVWSNNTIWTAGNTTCTPGGDTAARSCLDYMSVGADTSGHVTAGTQINNIGVVGADLFYPAVSIDNTGNAITVFDQSSNMFDESVMVAAIDSGATILTNFATLRQSSFEYANGCTGLLCRWGDYSGAAVDPNNPADVWVVSEDNEGSMSSSCYGNAQLCWNTYIGRYTFAAPSITSIVPSSGPVAGGQAVTVYGTDFVVGGTTVTFAGSTITPTLNSLTPDSFAILTPASATLAGGTVQTQATDSLGTTAETTASAYTYVGLANYRAVTPFRILDTRNPGQGGALGQGAIRPLQVTGVGTAPVPPGATAVVFNVTEVLGSASSLLTIYPYGNPRPTASNLNFAANTVIANLVTVTLGPHNGQGWVNIYNAVGTVNVAVDVEGYFTPDVASDLYGLFHPIAPVRVCDTRHGSPTPYCSAKGSLGPAASMVINFATVGGIPGDGSVDAAVVNLTGVVGTASTFLSLFPTDANGNCVFTGTSTINLPAGAVQANRVMVQLGPSSPGGLKNSLCIFNSAGSINVLIDANGWYGTANAPPTPVGYQYQALGPTRLCDTRYVSASCTAGAIGAGTSLKRLITVTGHAGVPVFGSATSVVAIIANLTAVNPTSGTFLAVFPANLTSKPTISDLNVNAGEVLPNLAVVQLDTIDAQSGDVYLYNSVGSVNAIIDLEGWFQ
ncbi:MAG: IPT/TIG domain-containing protein [Candidatus Dormibacteria bacterium]